MRTANRNRRKLWYCLYNEQTELVDEWGNSTGEFFASYGEATEMSANISPATGQSSTEQFGNLDDYDKVIVTTWKDCPIDENTVLFIDKEPEFDAETNAPLYDYIVRRVAKSLNQISIAVGKVNVS